MKFSLQAIFAVVTLSCLGAMIYQQQTRNIELGDEIEVLKTKVASYSPRLETDVALLRDSVGYPSRYTELHKKVIARFDESVGSLMADTEKLTALSVVHVPTLDGHMNGAKFQVFVPAGTSSFLDFETSKDDENSPAFRPNEPFQFELPEGLSTFVVKRKTLRDNASGAQTEFAFAVNEVEIYSIVCTTVPFVLPTPSFISSKLELKPGKKNTPFYSIRLIDVRDLRNGEGASVRCYLKTQPPEGSVALDSEPSTKADDSP